MPYPHPQLTVDVVVLSLRAGRLHVLTLRREEQEQKGEWALPGGFVHVQEDTDATASALRVLEAKVGLLPGHMEQLATFSGQNRDPRGWSASIAYLAIVSPEAPVGAGTWKPVDELPPMAFDHSDIIKAAVSRVRNRASYSSLPAFFLPEVFTLPQLQSVYEQVFGAPLNAAAFRRKVVDMEMIVPTELEESSGRGRPAQGYRLATGTLQDLGRVVLSTDSRRRPSL